MLLGLGLTHAAAIAVSLSTRYGGGVACMWLASGVLGAALSQRPPRAWLPVLAIVIPINVVLTTLIGLGGAGAVPLAILNAAEAGLLALAIRRWAPVHEGTMRTIRHVVALLVAGSIAAALTGVVGAGIATWVTATPFWANWFNWTTGHALGTVAIVPIAMLVLRGDVGTWWHVAGRGERREGLAILAVVAAVSIITFAQDTTPLLFLPLLPVILATFRIGRIGAALSITIVAMVAIVLSLRGYGPIDLHAADAARQAHFLQFYLAAIVLTVLPAAADLRRRKDVIHRLEASEARYRLVTENASDVVMSLDADGVIRFVSPSIEGLGNYRVDLLKGSNASALVHPEDRSIALRGHLEALRMPGTTHIVEYRCRPPSEPGDGRWVEMRVRAIFTGEGNQMELICAIRDISKRKAVEAELTLAARTDPLTGLANRRQFNDGLDGIVARVRRGTLDRACVALFDIDHFKRVNDSCGHDGGDQVLRRFAEVSLRVTRGTDIVARLGGEEFALVLPGADRQQARMVCERLRQEFAAEPTSLDDGTLVLSTVSAGVAEVGADSDRATLLRDADAALYAAKRGGRDRLVLAA